jgi:hypothetical protein
MVFICRGLYCRLGMLLSVLTFYESFIVICSFVIWMFCIMDINGILGVLVQEI